MMTPSQLVVDRNYLFPRPSGNGFWTFRYIGPSEHGHWYRFRCPELDFCDAIATQALSEKTLSYLREAP